MIDEMAAKKQAADSFGTPFSVRSNALLPLAIVENRRVKAALPFLGHSAYFALASGFLMTDILALRCLLVAGYSGLVSFHTLHARPLRIPLRWSAFFVAVNVAMVVQLARERWPGGLSDDDTQLMHAFFADTLSPSQFKQLLQLGERRTLPRGTRLTTEAEVCERLYFLESGRARLSVHGDEVAVVHRGGFVNDVAFQQGEGSAAYGTVDSLDEVGVIAWDVTTLRRALETDPALGRLVNTVLVRSLVGQLLQRYREQHAARTQHASSAAAQTPHAPPSTTPAALTPPAAAASEPTVDVAAHAAAASTAAAPEPPRAQPKRAPLVKRLSECQFREGLEGVRSRTYEQQQRRAQHEAQQEPSN